jgi:hypothetical protein
MAAMNESTTLNDKSSGVYEGKGQLPCGGTWQVTILARTHGQIVAMKKFSVNASGGM